MEKVAPPSDGATKRFAKPKTEEELEIVQKNSEPLTTARTNKWAVAIWNEWSKCRLEDHKEAPIGPPHLLPSKDDLNHWMTRFIVEIRRKDGKEYPPNTLYAIACAIMRHIRNYCPELNFFTQPEFHGFKRTLDSEMKRLKADGISINDEEQLWAEQLLGASSPHVLLDTMVFMCGMYFALRSGKEHRDLRFDQIKILTIDGKKCIQYKENCSKNNPGGLKHRKIEPKVVTHYENISDPSRCFVQLLEVYYSRCPPPEQRKTDSFYLTPIAKPKGKFWFSGIPVGHNTLSKTVSRLCKAAGIEGYKTNHSLRVTTATRLFQAGIDEQLIMKRTGHRSLEGVRTYKRTSETQNEEVSSILNVGQTSFPKKPKISIPDEVNSPYNFNFNSCTNVTITVQK